MRAQMSLRRREVNRHSHATTWFALRTSDTHEASDDPDGLGDSGLFGHTELQPKSAQPR
jgi:hypothetical protein